MYAGEELIHKPFQLYGLGELSKPGLKQTMCQHSLELIHKPFQLYGLGELSKPGLKQTMCQHSLELEMVSDRLCVSIALRLKWSQTDNVSA